MRPRKKSFICYVSRKRVTKAEEEGGRRGICVNSKSDGTEKRSISATWAYKSKGGRENRGSTMIMEGGGGPEVYE